MRAAVVLAAIALAGCGAAAHETAVKPSGTALRTSTGLCDKLQRVMSHDRRVPRAVRRQVRAHPDTFNCATDTIRLPTRIDKTHPRR